MIPWHPWYWIVLLPRKREKSSHLLFQTAKTVPECSAISSVSFIHEYSKPEYKTRVQYRINRSSPSCKPCNSSKENFLRPAQLKPEIGPCCKLCSKSIFSAIICKPNAFKYPYGNPLLTTIKFSPSYQQSILGSRSFPSHLISKHQHTREAEQSRLKKWLQESMPQWLNSKSIKSSV